MTSKPNPNNGSLPEPLGESAPNGVESLRAVYPELAEALILAIERMRKADSSPLDDSLIGEKRAATYLGVSLRTIINWRGAKLIPFYRIGGRILYRRSEIDEALKDKYRRGPILRLR